MMRLYFPAVRLLSRQCRQRTALYYAKKLSIFNYSKNTRSINCARSSSSSSRDDVVGDSFLSSLNTSDIETHRELLNQYRLHVAGGQSVFVIQPFLRNCSEFVGKGKIGHELKLSEALALVNTLEWGVVGYESLGMDTFERDTFFGSGQISNLMEKMKKLPQMTALFISKDKLRSSQRLFLESEFGVPVLDRYNVILQIFQLHAQTHEAKMQVALAEIPYLFSRLQGDWVHENRNKHSKDRKGREHFEKFEMSLKRRSSALKAKLEKIKSSRALLRANRVKKRIPTVAVVGYTNCGKTSLIKALTHGGPKLVPKDKLFATLDVTVHQGFLPNTLKVLYADTVGFISDIPTGLIASFSATLEDAVLADVLIHVRDVSHPDTIAQNRNVLQTLGSLNMPKRLLDNMITVGNKIDKIEPSKWKEFKNENFIPTSVTERYGLDFLLKKTEQNVMDMTGRKKMRFRTGTGSPELSWLNRNVTVVDHIADDKDPNYSIVTVIMSEVDLKQFKKAASLK